MTSLETSTLEILLSSLFLEKHILEVHVRIVSD